MLKAAVFFFEKWITEGVLKSSFFNDTAVQGGIVVLLRNRYFFINNCISKKARPPPGNIPLMNMNCLIIYILLIFLCCPIASCNRAFFVSPYSTQKVK